MYQPTVSFSTCNKLPLNDQGDYYLLLYKATLWKTGTPDDSLLQIAIRQYKQNEQQTQYVRARIEQSASYLYRNLPDSTLLMSEQILKGYAKNKAVRATKGSIQQKAGLSAGIGDGRQQQTTGS